LNYQMNCNAGDGYARSHCGSFMRAFVAARRASKTSPRDANASRLHRSLSGVAVFFVVL
jgi:hypothetical protein